MRERGSCYGGERGADCYCLKKIIACWPIGSIGEGREADAEKQDARLVVVSGEERERVAKKKDEGLLRVTDCVCFLVFLHAPHLFIFCVTTIHVFSMFPHIISSPLSCFFYKFSRNCSSLTMF